MRKLLGILLAGLLLVALMLQVACGGGSGNSKGTPSGNYTITVKAASGSIIHSTSVTLTVQ